MIVGAAVCPGAPFLIRGTADGIAARFHSVVAACAAAVDRLPAADAVLLITAAPRSTNPGAAETPAWRELPPGTLVSSSPIRRSDLRVGSPVALSAGPASSGPHAAEWAVTTLSVGTMVGAALLADVVRPPIDQSDPALPARRRLAGTTAIEIVGDPADVAEMLADRVAGDQRVALLVVADGSACHGDDAPGRRDDRAAAFDAAIADALAAGDPDALGAACADHQLAGELLAGVTPLSVLALLTAGHPPVVAELLFSGAPMGVGYLAASWRWSDG